MGVFERLAEAQNAHDAVRMAACFAADYRSEQPVHPGREFVGNDQVLENWTAVFAGVPDFRVELLASARDGDVEWGELAWRGHHGDGSPFAMRGVIVATVRDDLIAAARLYMEPVEQEEQDIAAAVDEVSHPTGTDHGA
jgi:hypothetical protein